ncbi:MAG: hypothetical protein AAB426_14850 [Myxococcota bacterium]
MSTTYVLAIDPGVRGCGAALFQGDGSDRLIAAAYVVFSRRDDEICSVPFAVREWVSARADSLAVKRVVLEFPQTYRGRAARGDTNDLLSLAFVDGAIAALFAVADVALVRPFDWKGSVPKPVSATGDYIIRSRVEARLSSDEKTAVVWPKNGRHSWDVADAVGIGLHHLGRFAPQRGAR